MIIVDVETTGIDEHKNSIIDIGAVDFYNPQNIFYGTCKIDEDAQISERALAFNGWTKEQVADPTKQSLESLLHSFLDWVRQVDRRTLAAQNPDFDYRFLDAAMAKYGMKLSGAMGRRKMDLHSIAMAHQMARNLYPELETGTSNLSGDVIMEYVGLPVEPKPHIGINGALWEAEAYARLIYGKNILTQFSEYALPEYLRKQ